MGREQVGKRRQAVKTAGEHSSDAPVLTVTKLFPPVSSGRLVGRKRLLHLVSAPDLRRLTLVAAPAGFGKTTFLAQLYDSLQHQGLRTCWLSLDSDDAVVSRFLEYFIGALRTIDEAIGGPSLELIESQAQLNLIEVVGKLINDLARIDDRVVVFLDDYHVVDNSEVNEAVEALLTLCPPNLSLVISTRTMAHLPVASLRVHDELTEIHATDLRFDSREAARFMRWCRGLDLTGDQIDRLQSHTEGWVAGLQLAALALRSGDSWSKLEAGFSGGLREVADYLAADVLSQQSEEIREFLLRTAVLARMTASLCDHLTARTDSQGVLDRLERDNLFVVPLDDQREWYRYHHMFRDFLLSQLKREHPRLVAELYSRARQWFAEHGLVVEAVNYALEGGDYDGAADLVEEHATRLMRQGRMPQLASWIRKIPDRLRARRPRLPMYMCWALFHMRQHHEAAQHLARAEAIVDALEATDYFSGPEEVESLRQELKVLHAGTALAADDPETAYRVTTELLAQGQKLGDFYCGATENIRGYACFSLSRFDEAEEAYLRARTAHARGGSVFGVVVSDSFLGILSLARGKLREAASLLEKAEREARMSAAKTTMLSAGAAIYLARVMYEWNRLDAVEELIDSNLRLTENFSLNEGYIVGLILFAQLKAVRGDHAAAEQCLRDAQSYCRDECVDRLQLLVNCELVVLLTSLGRVEEALELARSQGIFIDDPADSRPERWDRFAFLRDLIRVRLLLAASRPRRALPILEVLRRLARNVGRIRRLIELVVLSAVAEEMDGNRQQALAHLRSAMELGRPEGFKRSFITEGDTVKTLLHALMAEDGETGEADQALLEYARDLLAAARAETDSNTEVPPRLAAIGAEGFVLIEPLSRRESEVLALLMAGKANRAIARDLEISENTVKWHMKNIFEKLGVTNRTRAVLAAKELGLGG